ncbi:MAG TPA: GntR family transcriptional regulator [Roseiflexaceae bacterium]|nr:GntR family transcriptional regulator [Roseiflexaceae bacterium]
MQLEIAAGTRYQTKQELVYRTLREAIMRCQLQPGQRLVIEEIASQLAVSPIPVREALHILQSERLVETTPHVGATVARISRESVAEVFTVMEGLELVATRCAAQRMTEADGEELARVLDSMDQALAEGAAERWADLNAQFHRQITSIAGMPMLQEMTERAIAHWDRLRRFFFAGVLAHRMEQAQRDHRDILAAMRAQDYAPLEELVKRHNREALAAYNQYLNHVTD